MGRRIMVTKELYVDLDSFSDMIIEAVNIPVKTDNGTLLKTGFRVVGIHNNGSKVELLLDDKSGKMDECVNWVTKNWLR